MTEIWTEKYRPKTLEEFKGNYTSLNEVLNWVQNWKQAKENAILIHGGSGTGKTTLAFAIAKQLDYEILDTNASDIRTKETLASKLEQAIKQRPLFKKGKIILIDEIDGMGSSDRGGTTEIARIISETKFPVILTANDAYSPKLSSLRSKCKVVKFASVHQNSIISRLKEICLKEGVQFEEDAIKSIARRASGDLRSAINDLEFLARKYSKLELSNVNELTFRDLDQNIFQALLIIFKTRNCNNAVNATANLTENYEMLFNWIRENIPLEYEKNSEIALAYDFLSKADIFGGRIRKRQHWGLLKYYYGLLCAGVAISKNEKYSKFTKYRFPTNIRKMSLAKSKKAVRNEIGLKISKKLHLSLKKSLEELGFIKFIMREKNVRENLVENLEFSKEELEFIKNF